MLHWNWIESSIRSTSFLIRISVSISFCLFAYYFAEEQPKFDKRNLLHEEKNSWINSFPVIVMRLERHHLYIHSVEPRIYNRVSRLVRLKYTLKRGTSWRMIDPYLRAHASHNTHRLLYIYIYISYIYKNKDEGKYDWLAIPVEHSERVFYRENG